MFIAELGGGILALCTVCVCGLAGELPCAPWSSVVNVASIQLSRRLSRGHGETRRPFSSYQNIQ